MFYYYIGDDMKKLLLTCLFTTILSIMFGNYIFISYKRTIENIISASMIEEKVYMLLYGSYNSKEKVDNLTLENYILENENGFYKVYVGVNFSLENANKIKEIYKEKGNIIYIREKNISSLPFIDFMQSNEVDFSNLDKEKILSIENNIINKYKEIFNE